MTRKGEALLFVFFVIVVAVVAISNLLNDAREKEKCTQDHWAPVARTTK